MDRIAEVVLVSPRGFCAGVVRAIDIVNLCLDKFGPPVYVKHQIVHNPYVVEELEKKVKRSVFFLKRQFNTCKVKVPTRIVIEKRLS